MIDLDPILKYKIGVIRDGVKQDVSMYDATDAEFQGWFTREYFMRLTRGEDWTTSNRLLVRVLACVDLGKVKEVFPPEINAPTADQIYKAYIRAFKGKTPKAD